MKKLFFCYIACILSSYSMFSQREFWGVNKGIDDGGENSTGYKGNITKYDSNGQNPTIVHEFLDFATGKTPKGKLFLASNGKLYGMTIAGGNQIEPPVPFNDNGFGVLYEYDLVFNRYRVVHYFDRRAPNGIFGTRMLEPVEGKLYGSISNKIFSYDLATEVFSYLTGAAGDSFDGGIFKASNGFLYCTTKDSYCPGVNSVGPNNFGTIIKVDIINNSIQQVYQLQCDGSEGIRFSGEFIEAIPGKLFGITSGGGNATPGDGTVFEFDINTNTFTKKIDFDGDNLGSGPKDIVNGENGTLYGICENGGTNIYFNSTNEITYTEHRGTVFEYLPFTNTINVLHNFGNHQGTPDYFTSANPTSLVKSSTGDYFGISSFGVFKFSATDNSVVMPTTFGIPIPLNANVSESLTEICRKPSYSYIENDVYTICEGEAFTFDLHNTNAETYTWKKNDQIIASQTTGVLNLNDLEVSDSGNYICEMVNECGTTITIPIHLTIEACMGLDEAIGYKNAILLYPNPTEDIINIKLPENPNFMVTSVAIYNLLGQEVYADKSNYSDIKVGTFTKGIYIVKLTTDKGEWQSRFIKK
ncbi:T9SS type A sorting domain-containing protein [Flavobacterium sp. Sd200]|uniref:choice-of-anchor tandem repeat GloVer-containing protein n=1 Tax=Flavobacterium sp. Sd200 TaxID=2692211 RepID=UPI00136948E7|nr:T9SS type A sorting domain-containing protein [Flavobacterium sp. Sd200]